MHKLFSESRTSSLRANGRRIRVVVDSAWLRLTAATDSQILLSGIIESKEHARTNGPPAEMSLVTQDNTHRNEFLYS